MNNFQPDTKCLQCQCWRQSKDFGVWASRVPSCAPTVADINHTAANILALFFLTSAPGAALGINFWQRNCGVRGEVREALPWQRCVFTGGLPSLSRWP